MSLFSTIAHDGPIPARQFGPVRKALVVIALAAAVGLTVVALSPTGGGHATMGAATAELTNAQFVELNTVALGTLTPLASGVNNESFFYWNVDSLEGFTSSLAATRVDSHGDDFLYWNIASIDYWTPVDPQSATGPR